jgi:hypothetical protein
MVAAINTFGIQWRHVPAGVYYEEVDAFIGSYRNSLEEIRADVERGCFALLFGHFTARDLIVGCGTGMSFRKATTLREPVERLISEYFYSISTMHNGREATLKRFPTLEAWVYENTETEVISGFLEEYRGESAERIAARLLNEYAFVGLTENMGESCRAFGGLFGHEWSSETPKRNVNASRSDPVDGVLLKVLEERNARDVDLYRLVSSQIRAKLTRGATR